ncbi:MAG: helix-turn-helix domain-containing protein [Pseudonocardiales bacterium]|nr:helix-turn-helix domain-containing protein [Pseudonocardiales bacterium]
MPRGRRMVKSRRVAGELRRLRARSGHSCKTVGAALGISASKISRIETGRIGLQADEVAALLGFYQAPKPLRDELLELVRRAAEPGWWQVQGSRLPELWQELIDIERSATAIVNYEPLLIPGLLQTADYVGALIHAANPALSEDEVETRVAARTARQALLGRPHPPRLHALLEEGVLRRVVGDRGLMRRQVRHLEDAATRPNVTVQVVPTAAGAHPGLEGPFVILEFDGDPTLVYLENRGGSAILEEDADIDRAMIALRHLQQIALSSQDTLDLLAEVARELT